MRHALILAGGSGTRLWPMSREDAPKQLIPMIGGRSLVEIAYDRLDGLVPPERRHVGAAEAHRARVRERLPSLDDDRFLGEPVGRDTVNAIGLAAAVIHSRDPDAVMAVFTADHVIEPVERFREIVARGFALAESTADSLVTFGIRPDGPATGYGYLRLGAPTGCGEGRAVEEFVEKPDAATARGFFEAGPERYLWNSGMFVWRAATFLDCLRRYEPAIHAGLTRIAAAWADPGRAALLGEVFPTLRKVSVDFAVMEPASRDPGVRVLATPMDLDWLDVGSWTSYARTCPRDAAGNALGAALHLLRDTSGTLVASSDPGHLLVVVGATDLVVVHTPDATLVCPASEAQRVKAIRDLVREQFGPERV